MTTQIIPYLYFQENCREAMEFYRQCLGGDLKMQSIAETPAASQFPAEAQDDIMHAELVKDDLMIMASDRLRGELQVGNQIELMLNCSSEAELHSFFNSLSQDGSVVQPVHKEFWGAIFGQLTDRFGIHWMLNFS